MREKTRQKTQRRVSQKQEENIHDERVTSAEQVNTEKKHKEHQSNTETTSTKDTKRLETSSSRASELQNTTRARKNKLSLLRITQARTRYWPLSELPPSKLRAVTLPLTLSEVSFFYLNDCIVFYLSYWELLRTQTGIL